MSTPRPIVKPLTEPWELEQAYRLNFQTFVEEIPQHPRTSGEGERRLVDRLLPKSDAFVALAEGQVAGMVAVLGERPFSLDRKLSDLDSFLPQHRSPCEIRLLAVDPRFRGSRGGLVFSQLLSALVAHCQGKGYDLGLISAAQSQQRLYRHLGFVAFGPEVGTPEAPYRPMWLSWDRLDPDALRVVERGRRRDRVDEGSE